MTPLEEAERQSRLWHIAEAAAKIIEISASRSFDDYESDLPFRWAIERGLTIIGEAMVRLRKADPDIGSKITDVPDIIGFRNKLVHDYPEIEDAQVWKIIREQIPLLLSEVRSLLPST